MILANKYRPHYTYDDYCQWEGRWELIDGMPYAMSPAPIPIHQLVGGNLYSVFKEGLKKGCTKCKAYPPLDWKVNEDTVVQPDMLVVCNKIEKKWLDFPPVLVIEILSPATAAKDRNEKKELYLSQKVKYYLIIDPKFKKIEVYEIIEDKYQPISIDPNEYTFNFDEGCGATVDLSDIWD